MPRLNCLIAAMLALLALPVCAQTATSDHSRTEITVEGTPDSAAILPQAPTRDVFGLDLPVLDTPRGITQVSPATIGNYDIHNVDDLTAVAPSTFTAGYYNVPGSLTIRGSVADNYFHGFRRAENHGLLPTPVEGYQDITIVRGPPPPQFDAGKVGGYVDFDPLTAAPGGNYLTAATAELDFATGSYGFAEGTAQIGAPFTWGGDNKAGVYGFADFTSNDLPQSYYHGFHPDRQDGQLTVNSQLGDSWSTEFGGQIVSSSGYYQTSGWNRVTQALVNNGTYLTGQAPNIAPAGAAYLTPDAINTATGGAGLNQFIAPGQAAASANTTLAPSTVGTVKLSPRDIFVSPLDEANGQTRTGFVDLNHTLDNGDRLKIQGFYDDLNSQLYVSTGYAGQFRDWVGESRVSYQFDNHPADWLSFSSVGGVSDRYYDATDKEDYLRGYAVYDRRDLNAGATPNDIINFPYGTPQGPFDTNISSQTNDAGAFFNTQAELFRHLDFTAGVRYDYYHVRAIDNGLISFTAPLNTSVQGNAHAVSYNLSLSYKLPGNIVPYITYANSPSLETEQSGAIDPGLLISRSLLSPSELYEAGVKASLFDNRLFAAFDAFEQNRTQLDVFGAVNGTDTRGYEAEMRWAATPHIAITSAFSVENTYAKPPGNGGGATIVLPPQYAGLAPTSAYGGEYTSSSTLVPGLQNGFKIKSAPDNVISLFGTYTFDMGLAATLGATYFSATEGKLPGNTVKFPAYVLVRAGASYEFQHLKLGFVIDNLLDRRYFTPVEDIDEDDTAIPGPGRTFKLRVGYKF